MPDRPYGPTLARIVGKRLHALLHDAERTFKRGRGRELHALRIDVKRLRYTLECAVPLARDEALGALDLLALLQERLGDLADADSFRRTYTELAAALPAGDPRCAGIATLLANATCDRDRALEAARALWRGVDAPYPERLAASVSATLGSLSEKEAP